MKGTLRAEGVQSKDELIAKATQQANEELSVAREKLVSEIEGVRTASQGLVDELAGVIVSKVLGRSGETFGAHTMASTPNAEEEVQP